MITETAIPTIFQVELVEVAEALPTEEVGEEEGVGFQEEISGTVELVDDKTVRVPGGEDRATVDLVDEDEVDVLVWVDESVEGAEETVLVGPPGGNRISPKLGRRALVVVGVV